MESCKKHEFNWRRSCGCKVCWECDYHDGLVQCYCGWTIDGSDPEFDEPVDSDY